MEGRRPSQSAGLWQPFAPTPELLAQGMHYMHMDGRAVFRWAVGILCDTITDVLNFASLESDDVDLYIPHQANIRIINTAIDVLHIPGPKSFTIWRSTATPRRPPSPCF